MSWENMKASDWEGFLSITLFFTAKFPFILEQMDFMNHINTISVWAIL